MHNNDGEITVVDGEITLVDATSLQTEAHADDASNTR